MRKPTNTWFDRINRYRVAAVILTFPFILSTLTMDLEIFEIPVIARRAVYWFGLAVLFTAVAMDWLEVYHGRQEVEKRIRDRIREEARKLN